MTKLQKEITAEFIFDLLKTANAIKEKTPLNAEWSICTTMLVMQLKELQERLLNKPITMEIVNVVLQATSYYADYIITVTNDIMEFEEINIEATEISVFINSALAGGPTIW